MNNSSPKDLPTIRTFASDLATEKTNQSHPDHKEQLEVTSQESSSRTRTLDETVIKDDSATEVTPAPEATLASDNNNLGSSNVTVNPPFHSLQKSNLSQKLSDELRTVDKRETSQKVESVLHSDKTKIISLQEDETDDFSANIITDTKRNRFHLGSALVDSFKSWLAAKKRQRELQEQPKYTVQQSELRKGVVQQATSLTAKATTAEHQNLIRNIQERNQKIATAKKTKTKEPSPKQETNAWSHFVTTEPSTIQTISNVSLENRRSVSVPADEKLRTASVMTRTALKSNTPAQAKVIAPTLYRSPKTEALVPAAAQTLPAQTTPTEEPAPVIPVRPQTLQKETLPREDDLPQVVVPQPPTTVAAQPTLLEQRAESVRAERELRVPVRSLDEPKSQPVSRQLYSTNTLTMAVASVIVLLALGYVVTKVISISWLSSATGPAAVTDSRVTKVPLTNLSQESISRALASVDSQQKNYEFVFSNPDSGLIYTPVEILEVLGNAPNSFAQSLREIRFGKNSEGNYLILTTTSHTVALGGMLTWENSLGNDLNSIINSSRTGTFVDHTFSNTDLRILKNEQGGDSLVYGFIDNNHLLITKNLNGFKLVLTEK